MWICAICIAADGRERAVLVLHDEIRALPVRPVAFHKSRRRRLVCPLLQVDEQTIVEIFDIFYHKVSFLSTYAMPMGPKRYGKQALGQGNPRRLLDEDVPRSVDGGTLAA